MKHYHTLLLLLLLTLISCGKKKASDPLADTGRTQRTENLLINLREITAKGYLFGHQDATLYGVGWDGDSCRSDVKDICGDMPAAIGFEIGGIEADDSLNIYGSAFAHIRREIINQYDRSGMVCVAWHAAKPVTGNNKEAYLKKVASFLKSLETPYGVRVPVILTLYNHNGIADKALWQKAKEVFEHEEVVNALLAYSMPGNCEDNLTAAMKQYPGDDIIDLLGVEYYCQAEDGDTLVLAQYAQTLNKSLQALTTLGKQHGKPIAVTATGYQGIKSETWWTKTLSPVLSPYPISYVMLGRNAHDTAGLYHVPFPGQQSTKDFVTYYNEPKTLFLHDINGLYLAKEKKEKVEE